MKHIKIIFGLILLASVSTFAQSPRIKLNQITKDTVKGSVLISSPSDSGMVYSRDLFISYGADTVLILGGDTLAATSGIISSVLSDGVTIIGNGTIGSELTADTSVLATLRALSDSLALVISSVTADGVTITGDGTAGSPLKVDTATVVASVGRLLDSLNNVRTDLDLKQDQLNGTGFVKATGTTISYDNSTYLTSEVDGSVTNEGSLTVGAGTASTSVISSNTSGSTDVTLTAGSNVTLSESGNNITIAATGGGASYNNITETFDTVYISDHLVVDTSTLFVDAVNNNVGIGTSTPQGFLSIEKEFPSATTLGFTIEDPRYTGLFQVKSNASSFFAPAFEGFTGSDANNGSGTYYPFSLAFLGSIDTIQDVYNSNFALVEIQGREYDNFPSGASAVENAVIFNVTNSGAVYFRVEADGDVVMENDAYINGTTPVTSDFNLKNNINDYNAGLDKIMQLRSVSFYLNNDKNNSLNFGYIAQEVQDILPELIRQNNNNGYLYLVYENFIPIITNAIQEQQAIIETQATEIEQLKTQIQLILTEIEQLKNN